MYLILSPRRGILADLHGCFGDTLSHLYIQESGFVPAFSSDSSSTKQNGDISYFLYLAEKYRNQEFPWRKLIVASGCVACWSHLFMQQKSHGFSSLTRRTIQLTLLRTVGCCSWWVRHSHYEKDPHFQCSSTLEPCLEMLRGNCRAQHLNNFGNAGRVQLSFLWEPE